ncbi:MAG: prephenate dehydratase [Pycnora praestabilis]|nr:MAG: prephenate dehydratase [Pycnora praestabilis]
MTQQRPTVGYLGPPGSYSSQAALKRFDQNEFTLEPQASIEAVFNAVQSSRVDVGIVPFENSSNGAVITTLDLFADLKHNHSDIYVVDEEYYDVHHCLLGFCDPSGPPLKVADTAAPNSESATTYGKPLTGVKHIKRIYSHPQPFGQCEIFLSTYLKGAEHHEVSSTAKAAAIIAEDKSGSSAAIAGAIAAEPHGLNVLAKNIEDTADNVTHFLALQKSVHGQEQDMKKAFDSDAEGQNLKTLMTFALDHHSAGTLADVLTVFKRENLNITSINSRPSKVEPWHYTFFIEFETMHQKNPGELVKRALVQVQRVTTSHKWCGTWRSRQ